MKIFLLVIGTRGDLEILLALGRELSKRGHEVRLGSSPFFEPKVREAGLDWLAVGDGSFDDLTQLLERIDGEPDPRTRVERYFGEWVRPQLRYSASTVNRAVAEADYYINNLKSVGIRSGTVIPGASVSYELPGSIENLKKHLPRQLPHQGAILQLVALPRTLVDPDLAWGDEYVFTGFWQPPTTQGLASELEAFLADGAPPVVMTMGSMVCREMGQWMTTLSNALQRTGQRGIVVAGWSSLDRMGLVADGLYAVKEAEYESMFPRAACVIHHGGCGTVAAVMRSGRVSIVLPRIPSQSHFAELLETNRVSAGTLDPNRANPEEMARAIVRATTDPELGRAAEGWKQALAGVSGVVAAGDVVEAHARRLSCDVRT